MYYVHDSSIAGQLEVLPTTTELLDHQVNQFVEAGLADQQPCCSDVSSLKVRGL